MEPPVHRLEAVVVDVRVDLRRRDVAVAQQFLHHAQVRPPSDEVRREAVA